MSLTALWVPVLPFLAAIGGLLFGRKRIAGYSVAKVLAVGPTVAASLLALVVAVWHGTGDVEQSIATLTHTGGPDIFLGTRIDGLAAITALLVGLVATAVQVYSLTYMADDPRYSSYAALISLFTAAMFTVVYSADLLVLMVGWEIMGACSYFLIGHHWERPVARAAAIKAFLVTKTGDVPFLLGLLLLADSAGSFRIADVLQGAQFGLIKHDGVAAVLILGGVVGKSAQFPLHTWLPDAMAGPTPISALIHAATMVAAGVYVVARLYPVFLASPSSLELLGVLASITMLGAALAAFAQRDIKRILAYSTVSQLAYMAGGLAVGARTGAIFHLLSHGFFKALLFLGAGVVAHHVGSNDLDDIRDHGGLRKALPVTFVTMTVGLAALAGLPPFSGFFSKESILGGAYETLRHPDAGNVSRWIGGLVLAAGLLTAAVTAAYATRLWLKLFFVGNGETKAEGHREAPWTQLAPLIVLAVPAALFGFVGLDHGWFAQWLGDADGSPYRAVAAAKGLLTQSSVFYDLAPGLASTILSLAAVAAGLGAVFLVWGRQTDLDPAVLLGRFRPACERAFYIDELQDRLVVRPVKAIARAVIFTDSEVVDAYVRGSGVAARLLGGGLRRLQNGNVQLYLTGVAAGVVIIAFALGVAK